MNRVDLPEKVPPMFSVIAVDDFLFTGDFGVIKSWYEADVPVEFHLYQNGGHGFGLGNPDRTSNKWFDAFIHWLDEIGRASCRDRQYKQGVSDRGETTNRRFRA